MTFWLYCQRLLRWQMIKDNTLDFSHVYAYGPFYCILEIIFLVKWKESLNYTPCSCSFTTQKFTNITIYDYETTSTKLRHNLRYQRKYNIFSDVTTHSVSARDGPIQIIGDYISQKPLQCDNTLFQIIMKEHMQWTMLRKLHFYRSHQLSSNQLPETKFSSRYFLTFWWKLGSCNGCRWEHGIYFTTETVWAGLEKI